MTETNTLRQESPKGKIIFQVNQIEKTMRKMNKDIRRFEPKVKKAANNYKRYAENMEIKVKMLSSFTDKRDGLLIEFKGLQ